MKIGILETGRPPDRLAGRFPSYGWMTARLLGEDHDYTTFAVSDGAFPKASDAFAGFAITGSAAGVHDPLPWIDDLVVFLRGLDTNTKLVGLCFGHQVMAAAFGGLVAKSERGWGLGLHSYAVRTQAPFMDDVDAFAAPVSHQDQVVTLPPGAEIVAGNAFTPHGMLVYRDRHALSFQCHPEFAPDYARALVDGHRALIEHPELGKPALASLQTPHDSTRIGSWIQRFLKGA